MVVARSRGYSGSRDYSGGGRLGGLARLVLLVLGAIVVVILGVLLLFKALDWATDTPQGPGGHEHIL